MPSRTLLPLIWHCLCVPSPCPPRLLSVRPWGLSLHRSFRAYGRQGPHVGGTRKAPGRGVWCVCV